MPCPHNISSCNGPNPNQQHFSPGGSFNHTPNSLPTGGNPFRRNVNSTTGQCKWCQYPNRPNLTGPPPLPARNASNPTHQLDAQETEADKWLRRAKEGLNLACDMSGSTTQDFGGGQALKTIKELTTIPAKINDRELTAVIMLRIFFILEEIQENIWTGDPSVYPGLTANDAGDCLPHVRWFVYRLGQNSKTVHVLMNNVSLLATWKSAYRGTKKAARQVAKYTANKTGNEIFRPNPASHTDRDKSVTFLVSTMLDQNANAAKRKLCSDVFRVIFGGKSQAEVLSQVLIQKLGDKCEI